MNRLISDDVLRNICKHRVFRYCEDSHCRMYAICKADNDMPCRFQCTYTPEEYEMEEYEIK